MFLPVGTENTLQTKCFILEQNADIILISGTATKAILSDRLFYLLYLNYEGRNIVLSGSSVKRTLS